MPRPDATTTAATTPAIEPVLPRKIRPSLYRARPQRQNAFLNVFDLMSKNVAINVCCNAALALRSEMAKLYATLKSPKT
jgi:hypothetical protein